MMIADFDLGAPLPEGTVLLEASAGTGKTFSIAHLAIRYIAERGVPIEKLLVVTFTEAATRELSERIRARIREAIDALAGRSAEDPVLHAWAEASLEDPDEARRRRLHLELALANFDAASISTIHGFCRRVLSQAAFESSADEGAELLTDASGIHRDLVFDHLAKALTKLSAEDYGLLGEMRTAGQLSRFVEELVRNPKAQVLPEGIGKAEARARFDRSLDELRSAFRQGEAQLQAELERGIAAGIFKGPAAKEPELLREAFSALTRRLQKDGTLDGEERALFGLLRRDALLHGNKKKSWGALATDPVLDAVGALLDVDARIALEVKLEHLLPLVKEVRENLPAQKRKLGILTFDDLLQLVEASLAAPGSPLAALLRSRYRVALIDEFQDTDPVQWAIFRTIFHDAQRPLWLIGDPKQAIYSFRGADLEVYFQAKESANARFRLGRNHRSDQPLVDAVNGLFARDGAFNHPKLSYEPVAAAKGARIRIGNGSCAPLRMHPIAKPSSKGDGIVDWIASQVLGFLQSGAEISENGSSRQVTPRDCAVLVGTNKRARAIRDALRERGVPSVLLSDESVLHSEEARELGVFLRAISMPERMSRLLAFLATRIVGLDVSEIDVVREDEAKSAHWIELLSGWAKLYRGHGLMHAVRAMASELKVETRLASTEGGERRLADFFHTAELLHSAQLEQNLDPEDLALYLDRERADESDGDEARKLRLETDADAVEIVTVHRSKGLEYPVVFCADLFDERRSKGFPLRYSQGGERILHLAPDTDAHDLARQDALEESLRLAYVALTRAKHLCSVLYLPGPQNGGRLSALDWLFFGHLDEPTRKKAIHEPLAPLKDLFAETEGGIAIDAHGFMPSSTRFRPASHEIELAPASYQRKEALDRLWRWSSFSSIVRGREAQGFDDDNDESVSGPSETALSASIAKLEGARTSAHLAGFRHGTELGSLVHEVLETIDFRDPGDLPAAVEKHLGTYGLRGRLRQRPELVTEIADMIADMLATEIVAGGEGFTLGETATGDRLSEMRFAFPVLAKGLPIQRLAQLFARHARATFPKEYADALASLRSEDLAGLVHGSVDLVFRRGDRYYLADFKTNDLGDELGHYHPTSLVRAIHKGRYFLQGQLYALALHRYLQHRLRGYDPAAHFGGVFFFFVRGMTKATGSRFGIHYDEPQATALRELDELFAQKEGEKA